MANSYFQFKQFKIEQGSAAMKVSTDACIQGAWTAVQAADHDVLDIGCGTGLLSLMLAQKQSEIQIDAVELDADAALQASQNVKHSPWSDRINVFQEDIKDFRPEKKYDLIICNPPFFQNSLLGPDELRNQARHNHTLSYQDLFDVIEKHLHPSGRASILLPSVEHTIWETIVQQNGWSVYHKLLVYPSVNKTFNRVVSIIGSKQQETILEALQIRDAENNYSETFTRLLGPYYLKL
ncbi:tRNA1(Val) (adenine(37)-N6)-methyltransferase [Taibaiella soli]|uniref:tRNA1(Val) (adenine(37)-N6)-methyltransferase n=1 Tax=Taibaiella soli TaxID=1649169 RepID=A0A2W2AU93_9BACT|nr:methyltransferase [Taibaiella soli]PZF71544.1 tRNA (adenine-N(6)-)-methyltransferase [Taibaiella soli]